MRALIAAGLVLLASEGFAQRIARIQTDSNRADNFTDLSSTPTGRNISVTEPSDALHVKVVNNDTVTVRQNINLTVSTAAYAPGRALGGLITLDYANAASSASGVIQKVMIIDDDQELASIDIVFFDSAFTPTADNVNFAPSDAQMENCLGVVSITNGNYANFSTNSVATRAGLGMAFDLSGTGFYAQCVSRGTPTYTTANDVSIVIDILVK